MALLVLTLLAWLLPLIISTFPALNAPTLGALLLAFAFIKVRLITIHFMEANKAHWLIRVAFEAWVILVGGITIGLYLR